MYLYNVADVYSDNVKDCTGSSKVSSGTNATILEGIAIKFDSKRVSQNNNVKTTDGKYIYVDGKSFPNVTFGANTSLKVKSGGSGLNNYFYGYADSIPICRSNANSIALLFEVTTSKGKKAVDVIASSESKKYMYFPSDLDNNGYPLFGANNTSFNTKIYSSGSTYYYANNGKSGKNRTWTFTNNKLVKATTPLNVNEASEFKVAKRISDKLGSNKSNIVIYQQSHHGQNNSLDAITKLGLNNNKVYAVAPNYTNPKSSTIMAYVISNNYTLSKANKLFSGGNKNGIYCFIKYDDTYKCSEY